MSARPVTHASARLRRRLPALRPEAGFSLIELLIVMLVLGILLGIGLTAFAGQDTRAGDAGSKALARDASHAMEQCYLELRNYPLCGSGGAGGQLQKMGLVQSDVAFGTGVNQVSLSFASGGGNGGADNYQVLVKSPSGALWKITRTGGGLPVRTCNAGAGFTFPRGDCRSPGMPW